MKIECIRMLQFHWQHIQYYYLLSWSFLEGNTPSHLGPDKKKLEQENTYCSDVIKLSIVHFYHGAFHGSPRHSILAG